MPSAPQHQGQTACCSGWTEHCRGAAGLHQCGHCCVVRQTARLLHARLLRPAPAVRPRQLPAAPLVVPSSFLSRLVPVRWTAPRCSQQGSREAVHMSGGRLGSASGRASGELPWPPLHHVHGGSQPKRPALLAECLQWLRAARGQGTRGAALCARRRMLGAPCRAQWSPPALAPPPLCLGEGRCMRQCVAWCSVSDLRALRAAPLGPTGLSAAALQQALAPLCQLAASAGQLLRAGWLRGWEGALVCGGSHRSGIHSSARSRVLSSLACTRGQPPLLPPLGGRGGAACAAGSTADSPAARAHAWSAAMCCTIVAPSLRPGFSLLANLPAAFCSAPRVGAASAPAFRPS